VGYDIGKKRVLRMESLGVSWHSGERQQIGVEGDAD
jgi:hypothetical protein